MIYRDKDYSNRRIHLGLIAHCQKGCPSGLIFGLREPPYNGQYIFFENKLFFFDKESELEIQKYTLVSYLSYDYDGFTPKVDYVYPVSSLVIHHDERGSIYRDDEQYHDDETWRLINEGIPFFDYGNGGCIYYPIIKGNICTVWCGLLKWKEASIYEMYRELTTINYRGWPTLNDVTDAVIRFKDYVDAIDHTKIIDTYKILKIGIYKNIPGKDTYYVEYVQYSLSSDDKYLSFLLPSKEEEVYYGDGPSDKFREGKHILLSETLRARKKAKVEYSKEKHLAFLINDFFSNTKERKEKSESLKSDIYAEFDVDNADVIVSDFNGNITDEFLTLINEYNESTLVEPLFCR